ncbi:MAG: hypothetical protein WDN66_00535 [Candidatus Saccharibacteria bacterium]
MNRRRTFTILITLVVIAIAVYMVVSALSIKNSTGVLDINSSDPSATIAISANNSQSQYLGLNSVSVRLKPGAYLISAVDQSNTVTSAVTVSKGQTTTKNLNINEVKKTNSKNNSLLSKLPFTGPVSEYTINYNLNYNGKGQFTPVIIIGSTSPQAKQAALSWFQYDKFNLNDYKVEYQSLNPLPASYNYF